MSGKCETCRWWAPGPFAHMEHGEDGADAVPASVGMGECHFAAPVCRDGLTWARFPMIHKRSFCGQWKEKA